MKKSIISSKEEKSRLSRAALPRGSSWRRMKEVACPRAVVEESELFGGTAGCQTRDGGVVRKGACGLVSAETHMGCVQ